jgi:hypothetical protein
MGNVFEELPERIRSGEEKMTELRQRWAKRHDKIWDRKVELGLLPPRTKEMRVRDGDEARVEFEDGLWREEVLARARRDV